jgi:hypothetical protein
MLQNMINSLKNQLKENNLMIFDISQLKYKTLLLGYAIRNKYSKLLEKRDFTLQTNNFILRDLLKLNM